MKKMTLNKLIKELKELKNNGVWENDIPTIQNLVADYQYDQNDYAFDGLMCEIVGFETVMECVEYKARQLDFWGVQNIMEGLEKADYYKNNGDEFENITDEDVEERLDEIIEIAKGLKK